VAATAARRRRGRSIIEATRPLCLLLRPKGCNGLGWPGHKGDPIGITAVEHFRAARRSCLSGDQGDVTAYLGLRGHPGPGDLDWSRLPVVSRNTDRRGPCAEVRHTEQDGP